MLTTLAAGDKIVKCVLGEDFGKERENCLVDDELIARIDGARRKIVGTKQTLKALEKGEAIMVILARDAEERISAPVAALAGEKEVEVCSIETMSTLGKICGVKVKAAAAAILEF